MHKFLVIQTAFTGDVILATGILEKLHAHYPHGAIHILVRKGNESLFDAHPFVQKVMIWDKRKQKYKNLRKVIEQVRKENYDVVVNVQRFFSTGLITLFSGAKVKIGFDKNPLSRFFSRRISHEFKKGVHEVERNHLLIQAITDQEVLKPRLYPGAEDKLRIEKMVNDHPDYICIAPCSVWFTKQFPQEKWISLINLIPDKYHIYLIGGAEDREISQKIIEKSNHARITNLTGQLSLLASAELMRRATMNYVNDSAPMHLASALNAPVSVVYCSTLPEFGYGPLSDLSYVFEIESDLYCRPCGIHGKSLCPQKHFKCAYDIELSRLLTVL